MNNRSCDNSNNQSELSLRRRLRRAMWHLIVRQLMLICKVALVIAGWIGRRRRPIGEDGCVVMLTGRFDSANWILNHLGPLAASSGCSRLWMVSTNPVPEMDKVEAIYPPKWLMKVLGVSPARLLTFIWAAICKRPDVVGGFYLIFNGIVAAITGRLVGARSIYFCVAGPPEICNVGVTSENAILAKMETSDVVVGERLLSMAAKFDTIITMGTKAVDFFKEKGIVSDYHVVSGGIDSKRYQPSLEKPSIDMIMTGRLVSIKRIDVFLHAIKYVADEIPDVRVAIVGDGILRDDLQALSKSLGIEQNVNFAGLQNDIENWLQKAKIFVLTSDSEGLALSMMEAMMSGLPAVVSEVGDLGNLVEDGINGYLVPRREPRLFADRFIELLFNSQKREDYSKAARNSAMKYSTEATIEHWNDIFANYRKS